MVEHPLAQSVIDEDKLARTADAENFKRSRAARRRSLTPSSLGGLAAMAHASLGGAAPGSRRGSTREPGVGIPMAMRRGSTRDGPGLAGLSELGESLAEQGHSVPEESAETSS